MLGGEKKLGWESEREREKERREERKRERERAIERERVREGESRKQLGQVLTMQMKRMTDGELLCRSLCG